MIRKVKIEWKINDFSKFTENFETKSGKISNIIYSPTYSFSPDETNHLWKICFRLNRVENQEYDVFLKLADDPVLKSVSACKLYIQLTDYENNVFWEKKSKVPSRIFNVGKKPVESEPIWEVPLLIGDTLIPDTGYGY